VSFDGMRGMSESARCPGGIKGPRRRGHSCTAIST
jgi:hypothetical protein